LGIPIIPNDFISEMVESIYDIPGRDDFIGPLMWYHELEQFHQTGLPTTHRSREEKALIQIDAQLFATFPVPDKVETELVQHFPVLPMDPELFAEQEFSLGIEIDQYLLEIVFDLPALQGAQFITYVTFGDDMWGLKIHNGSL